VEATAALEGAFVRTKRGSSPLLKNESGRGGISTAAASTTLTQIA